MHRRDLGKFAGLGLAGTAILVPQLAQAQAGAKSRLAQILERGTLRVGTTGDFNPMSFRDPGANEYKGYDIEAMTALAGEFGLKLEWVQTEWAAFIAGIAAGRFDIFSGASITMARAKTGAFTLPYADVGTVPLALKPAAAKFGSWDAINADGVRVAVSMGTVFEDQAKRTFPKAQLRSVQTPATGFQEVLAGRADVTITSNIEAATLVKRYEQLTVVSGAPLRNKRPLAYVVAQGEIDWLNAVNSWILLKRAEGFFDALDEKWLKA